MFELLGWDMTNKKGFSDAYKEVLYEESIKAGAPDYSFRIGGNRKFFVEAKAPHVNIATDSRSAAQLRSYTWSAKLSLSILTNFAHLAVYDGRIPVRSELPAPGEARVLLIPYTEYPARWTEIESIFSQQAIGKGLFDRFADSKTDKRGTAPVDEEFLDQISHWRDRLASCLREANPAVTAPELNFAVQMIIDRIVFLRIAEDRGLEIYGQLQTIAKVHSIYGELLHLFQAADTRYNSGLFHFRAEAERSSLPDDLTPGLSVSDAVLQDIITGLYPPRSHYRFSHVPSEILGQVYEQFLGKVIVLTAKRAKVEDKPEVRKAGGVYYTPSYIVNYIVDNTLGTLLEAKTPEQVEKLKVLDPACGSGSFLLGAYQKLLDWHLDYYYHHEPEKLAQQKHPPIRQIPAPPSSGLFESKPSYRLTIAERKRILTNNIFGVDIDTQAVEVTKLSLLLKCLENETAESVQSLLKFMRQRALPDLDDNIKCGNSLIAHDFYDPANFPENQSLTDDEKRRINAFDWKQGFPKIMKAGGFDAVIANPPYGADVTGTPTAYLRAKYKSPANSLDTFLVFVEKSADLVQPGGLVGMIVPSGWVSTPSAKPLREIFLQKFDPTSFVTLPFDVFHGAYIDTGIFTAAKPTERNADRDDSVRLVIFPPRHKIASADEFRLFAKTGQISAWRKTPNLEFLITASQPETHLVQRIMDQRAAFGDYVQVKRGIEVYHPVPRPADLPAPKPALTRPIQRYDLRDGKRGYISYTPDIADSKPLIFFSGPRILLRQVLSRKLRIQATFAAETFLTNQSVQSLIKREDASPALFLQFFLGILNSRLMSWYFKSINSVARRDDYPKIIIKQTRELPIPPADLSGRADKARHDRMVQLVTRMLDLHQNLAAAKLATEKTRLQREIAATDDQIDALVYELYNLTPEEIRIVEEATG
jgi:hypothetical protein